MRERVLVSYFLRLGWKLEKSVQSFSLEPQWTLTIPNSNHRLYGSSLNHLWECWKLVARDLLRRAEAVEVLFDKYVNGTSKERDKILLWLRNGDDGGDEPIWKTVALVDLSTEKEREWRNSILELRPVRLNHAHDYSDIREVLSLKVVAYNRKELDASICQATVSRKIVARL